MNALVGKFRAMARNKALDIGTAWNALDEAADVIESISAYCIRRDEEERSEGSRLKGVEREWSMAMSDAYQEIALYIETINTQDQP